VSAALLILAAARIALAAPADLSVILTYETRTAGLDGITRTTTHQDRFYRREGHVWIERVVPAAPAKQHGHRDLDMARVARHVQPGANGGVKVELVDVEHKLLIDVAPSDLSRVEVGARWDDAWYLLSPAELAKLTAAAGKAPPGARWLERRDGDDRVRVLWSDALGFPLEIERTRKDGSSRAVVHAQPIASPKTPPWSDTAAFRRKDLSDFSD
jgi:hypothetical protein